MILNLETKPCKTCGVEKPHTEYRVCHYKSGKTSVYPICKDCERENGRIAARAPRKNKKENAAKHRKTQSEIAGVIYFVIAKDVGRLKIGHTSSDIIKRMRALQGNSPVELTLIGYITGTVQDERDLHARFVNYRQHYEWFLASSELMAYIENMSKSGSLKELNESIMTLKAA